MNKTETQHNWTEFLKTFSRQNKGRPTRIGVFEGKPGAMTDYWLEDGLPLDGIDIDTHGDNAPTVEIMLGNAEKTDSRTFTHIVKNAQLIKITLSASGDSDGLEIEDERGGVTLLRFENFK